MGSPSNGKGCFMTRFYPRESAGICGSKFNAQFRLQLRHVVPCEPVASLVFFAVLQQLQQVHHLSAAFGGGYRLSRSLAIQRGKRHVEPLAVMLGEPLLHHLPFHFRRHAGTLRATSSFCARKPDSPRKWKPNCAPSAARSFADTCDVWIWISNACAWPSSWC